MPPIDIARRTLNRVLRLPKLLLTCVVVVLFAALSAGQFAKAHERLARGKKPGTDAEGATPAGTSA